MKQKNSFSGQIGFVFAAAGSAVGVGNLWRFPYLAAKYGGGTMESLEYTASLSASTRSRAYELLDSYGDYLEQEED